MDILLTTALRYVVFFDNGVVDVSLEYMVLDALRLINSPPYIEMESVSSTWVPMCFDYCQPWDLRAYWIWASDESLQDDPRKDCRTYLSATPDVVFKDNNAVQEMIQESADITDLAEVSYGQLAEFGCNFRCVHRRSLAVVKVKFIPEVRDPVHSPLKSK